MDRQQDLFDLSAKTALITGGGRGIGLAIARTLGRSGARIVVGDVHSDRAKSAAAELRSMSIDATSLPLDVTSSSAVKALFSVAYESGGIDIVVNNAGISARIPAEEYPDDEFDAMMDVNLKGAFYVMRTAGAAWIATGKPGTIINIASFAGIVADPLSAPYAATKGGLVQLTRTCAVEWAPHRIRVNAIAPGYVTTDMTSRSLADGGLAAAILDKIPLGRVAEPHEIAAAALFLASPASSYVTGHVLCVDGGWTAV